MFRIWTTSILYVLVWSSFCPEGAIAFTTTYMPRTHARTTYLRVNSSGRTVYRAERTLSLHTRTHIRSFVGLISSERSHGRVRTVEIARKSEQGVGGARDSDVNGFNEDEGIVGEGVEVTEEELREMEKRDRKELEERQKSTRRFLRFIKGLKGTLNVVIAVLYIATMLSLEFLLGAVGPPAFFFCISAHLYLYLLGTRRFLKDPESLIPESKGLFPAKWVMPYAAFMGAMSVLVPWFLVITNPDKYAPIMAPHLYVMMWQIMVEKLSSKWAKPARVLVPIVFNSFRLLQLVTYGGWIFSDDSTFALTPMVFSNSDKAFGILMCFSWTANLLVFLLPFVLDTVLHPKYRKGLSKEDIEKEIRDLTLLASTMQASSPAASVSELRDSKSAQGA